MSNKSLLIIYSSLYEIARDFLDKMYVPQKSLILHIFASVYKMCFKGVLYVIYNFSIYIVASVIMYALVLPPPPFFDIGDAHKEFSYDNAFSL